MFDRTLFLFLWQDLEIKSLVIESYHMGSQELLYIIPFIAKILESCSRSKVSDNEAILEREEHRGYVRPRSFNNQIRG